eukprot:8222761-Prorocentrum_lima.AAC.1
MTSSLVGSEMCIRDSHTKSTWKEMVLDKTLLQELLLLLAPDTYLTKAVSYTHLTLPTICSV